MLFYHVLCWFFPQSFFHIMAEVLRYSEKCILIRLLEFKIKKFELQRVSADGTYCNHCSLKGYLIRK